MNWIETKTFFFVLITGLNTLYFEHNYHYNWKTHWIWNLIPFILVTQLIRKKNRVVIFSHFLKIGYFNWHKDIVTHAQIKHTMNFYGYIYYYYYSITLYLMVTRFEFTSIGFFYRPSSWSSSCHFFWFYQFK